MLLSAAECPHCDTPFFARLQAILIHSMRRVSICRTQGSSKWLSAHRLFHNHSDRALLCGADTGLIGQSVGFP